MFGKQNLIGKKDLKISYLEEQFERSIARNCLPQPVREHNFHRWRFDFAWPKLKVAVEIDGATFSGGNHVRGKGYQRDCKKHNQAQLEGWAILRADSEMSGTDDFALIVKKMLLERIKCYRMTDKRQ